MATPLHILKDNIVEVDALSGDTSLNVTIAPEMVENIKQMYGVDLTNQGLLRFLKDNGEFTISTLDNCPTKTSEATPMPADDCIPVGSSIEYTYDRAIDWAKRARSSVNDVMVLPMGKSSKSILLCDARECLDLLVAALVDSQESFGNKKFKIISKG